MTPDRTRHGAHPAPPTVGRVGRDILLRAALPAVVLFAVVLGIGLAITGPLHGFPAEQAINRSLAAGRTPRMDAITAWGTLVGSTLVIAACTALAMVLVWGLTRQWWSALVPGIAVLLQFVVFISVEALVHRPRPDVAHLDQAPPTSSFPSGHAGAATALWLSLAFLAQRIRTTWVRVVVTVICVAVPLAVGYSRLYRGMHNATDVGVGLLNGAVCAVLAHRYLRRELPAAVATAAGAGTPGPDENRAGAPQTRA